MTTQEKTKSDEQGNPGKVYVEGGGDASTNAEAWGSYAWPFKVEEGVPGSNAAWCASLPFRNLRCDGSTRDEAIGSLIHYYAELARSGGIDPSNPEDIGQTTIAHTITVLAEALEAQLRLRKEVRPRVIADNPRGKERRGSVIEQSVYHYELMVDELICKDPEFVRVNSSIAGIGTAMAALGRVQAL